MTGGPSFHPGAREPSWRVALRLGRVSNLPTVWTNVLVGIALGGESPTHARAVPLALAMSLFYVGGMYLNDAFDAPWDLRNRPERPIPAGQVSVRTVLAAGFGMLAAGLVVLAIVANASAVVGGLALAALIVAYDVHHKDNAWSPVLMGLCRAAVYVTCGVAVSGRLFPGLVAGAATLLAYLIGLSYVAKQEVKPRFGSLWPLLVLLLPFAVLAPTMRLGLLQVVLFASFLGWTGYALSFLRGVRARPNVPRAVVSLIAGISLLDAVVLGAEGTPACFVAVGAFLLTLLFQRFVPGT